MRIDNPSPADLSNIELLHGLLHDSLQRAGDPASTAIDGSLSTAIDPAIAQGLQPTAGDRAAAEQASGPTETQQDQPAGLASDIANVTAFARLLAAIKV
jgi:hypothetical protein